MKNIILYSIILLIISLNFTACFSSSGSLFSDTVKSDGSSSKDDDEDDYYYNNDDDEDDGTVTGLSIETDPDGCNIYIDGRYRGVSPLFLNDLDSGYYTVTAEHDGYYSKTESVYHSASGYTVLSMFLEQKIGFLEITADPPEAEVLFDNYLPLESPREKLPVGTYSLTVRLFGYTEYKTMITIIENNLTTLSVSLKPAEFAISGLNISKERINPNAPAAYGETTITVGATNLGYGDIRILNSDGEAVLGTNTLAFDKFETELVWDGSDKEGHVQPDGVYTVILTAWESEGAELITRTAEVVLDSSYVFDLWNVWSGSSGLLFCALPSVLPEKSFSISVLALVSMGLDQNNELTMRMPVQAGFRKSLFRGAELDLQGTFVASPSGNPFNLGAAFKYRFINSEYFDSAVYTKLTYVYDTQADPQANFTGLYAGAAISAGTGKVMFNINPEVCFSYTYPNWEPEPAQRDFYNYAYLRGGIYVDMFTWSLGMSASFRTRPFSEGFRIDMPLSAGIEANFIIPDLQMKIGLAGALQWRNVDDYYSSFGIDFGFVN